MYTKNLNKNIIGKIYIIIHNSIYNPDKCLRAREKNDTL